MNLSSAGQQCSVISSRVIDAPLDAVFDGYAEENFDRLSGVSAGQR